MDEPRRSNWRDAENVAMPRCPKCGEINQPGQSPMIERIGRVYVCAICGCEFLPVTTAA